MIETTWASKQTVESEQKALSITRLQQQNTFVTEHRAYAPGLASRTQAIPREEEGLVTPSPEMLLGH